MTSSVGAHGTRRITVDRVGIVVAVMVGVAGGYALRVATEPEHGRVIDGGSLQQVVYEAVPDPGSAPPQCRSETDDGIGSWECVVEPRDGDGPAIYHVDVSKSGAVRGRAADGTDRFTSCCLELLDT
ncbi:MAG TPA: hypothetical protein VHJ34_10870 [Actinomycetota bacterium]|nr:hypothetical protein [Actinomycetota bacterium]